jgi:hypothetical protein
VLIEQARDLADRPYLPSAWTRRAETLFALGYPELAAGDAYKALLLCDAGLCYEISLGVKVRLVIGILLMLRDPEAVC